MGFEKFTSNRKICYIKKDEVVHFGEKPNEECVITLRGGIQIDVQENIEFCEKVFRVNQPKPEPIKQTKSTRELGINY
ncbi:MULTISPECIES: hypothetical protein [Flavobacterium]|uniref:hypothetical protein n=1 Tax=Flavobacterium TaxID=237 RepID=UPI00211581A8|nr:MULTISPECIES: hypothetical protein [Flavobacterium]UUF13250.1 hypothetical protein NLJ00_18480 [Flavobacterium panici]